ncbi:MAG: peptidoglycan DD-metalloendopeptidase family protein [Bacteroidota bacterium]|nr:peptidoglycan DD-metalloendopeptidase family protein [Bacteroidota bacterium]
MKLISKYQAATLSSIKTILAFVLVTLICSNAFGQQSRKDLERLRIQKEREIKQIRSKLNNTRLERRQTLAYLEDLDVEIQKRQDYLSTLAGQKQTLKKIIIQEKEIIEALQNDLIEMKKEYAEMIYQMYKNTGDYNVLSFIVSAESFNGAVKRAKLLQFYKEHKERQLQIIVATKNSLLKKVEELEQTLYDQNIVTNKLNTESENLEGNMHEKYEVAQNLKKKEIELREQLREKRRAAERLDRAISDAIRREVATSNGPKNSNRPGKTNTSNTNTPSPETMKLSGNFAANKSKMPWPVRQGVIIERFGKHELPGMDNFIVDSKGLRFRTSSGVQARAIFTGEISKIVRIPNAGIAIIIRHGEYFTVYSGLENVTVGVGDEVKPKTELGTIAKNTINEEYELGLQIWKGREILNPIYWILDR